MPHDYLRSTPNRQVWRCEPISGRLVVATGREVTLKLKPKGKKAKKELVKRGAKAKAKITVTLTDLAGNSTSEKASSS